MLYDFVLSITWLFYLFFAHVIKIMSEKLKEIIQKVNKFDLNTCILL